MKYQLSIVCLWLSLLVGGGIGLLILVGF